MAIACCKYGPVQLLAPCAASSADDTRMVSRRLAVTCSHIYANPQAKGGGGRHRPCTCNSTTHMASVPDSIITGCGLPLHWPRCARATLNIEQLVVLDMFEQHLTLFN